MDAVKLLKEDHRRLRDLLHETEKPAASASRLMVFENLKADLQRHQRREEEVLYPALEGHPDARDMVLEGLEEHHVSNHIVDELTATAETDERWPVKFKVLRETLEHHFEEEEHETFKRARDLLGKDVLETLGGRMEMIHTPVRSD